MELSYHLCKPLTVTPSVKTVLVMSTKSSTIEVGCGVTFGWNVQLYQLMQGSADQSVCLIRHLGWPALECCNVWQGVRLDFSKSQSTLCCHYHALCHAVLRCAVLCHADIELHPSSTIDIMSTSALLQL